LVLASILDFRNLTIINIPYIVLILIFYFTYPANLLIYGVNDIADRDTDLLNDKKGSYENLLQLKDVKLLLFTIAIANIPFVFLLFNLPYSAVVSIFLFWFFSIFYSLKPIRAKAIPFIDSIFNILYIFPAITVYFALGGNNLNFYIIAAGTLWVMAMHAYSAIPDIDSDKQANLKTSATILGKNGALIWCFILYLGSAILGSFIIGGIAYLLFLPYAIMMIFSAKTKNSNELLGIYKYFPYINTLCGMILFFYIVLQRI
jgi:4-hydroxybenzoate polyprenyltransferase